MFKSILVTTDFSPASWHAFRLGVELGKSYSSEVCLFHVFPVENKDDYSDDLMLSMRNVKNSMERLSNDISSERSKEILNVVVPGSIEQELMSFVKKNNFDLVIMGVNGNGNNNVPGRHTLSALEKISKPILVVPNNYGTDE